MKVRVVDLDGSIRTQRGLREHCKPDWISLQGWGPQLRMACSFRSFRRFQDDLARHVDGDIDQDPMLTFVGSGDFHHVSLALVHRVAHPVNLLVFDNHPDWMRGVPFLHCGTWLYHAAKLPWVHQIFHVGGNVDFDNAYRWMAPWSMLRSNKIVVIPALRPYRKGNWTRLPHESLRHRPNEPASRARCQEISGKWRESLAARPLYISLDKDVMVHEAAVINWDSGHLVLDETCDLLDAFLGAAGGDLAGMDIVGDWSHVAVAGRLRKFMHWSMHADTNTDALEAARCNDRTNMTLVRRLEHWFQSPDVQRNAA